MRYLTYIVSVPLVVFSILFSISNPEKITVSFLLLDEPLSMPLSWFGLGMLFGGFLLGALFVWLQLALTRLSRWRLQRHAARLEKELARARQGSPSSSPQSSSMPSTAALPAPAPRVRRKIFPLSLSR